MQYFTLYYTTLQYILMKKEIRKNSQNYISELSLVELHWTSLFLQPNNLLILSKIINIETKYIQIHMKHTGNDLTKNKNYKVLILCFIKKNERGLCLFSIDKFMAKLVSRQRGNR